MIEIFIVKVYWMLRKKLETYQNNTKLSNIKLNNYRKILKVKVKKYLNKLKIMNILWLNVKRLKPKKQL